MPRYKFFIKGYAQPTELVAESFASEDGTIVFSNVTEIAGHRLESASLQCRVDGNVEQVAG